MATLVLQTVGAIAGQFLGGPIGAAIGQTVGAVAGNVIDQRLFGPRARDVTGPRLTSLAGLASTEGAAIPRVYGRARIGGQMIWATRFEEVVNTSRVSRGGKGGGGAKQTSYAYYANFAVGLCEGPIAQVRRIWADGKELDQTLFTIRVHLGDEDQEPDPLIVAKEGADVAPAYRGLAYVVFERMPLADFGNRAPQLTFEVVRPLGRLAQRLRGVDVIPGAGEYAYQPETRIRSGVLGAASAENRHVLTHESDWSASLDALQAVCPNVESAALVVSWFGDDLRAGRCTIAPRVDEAAKLIAAEPWSVAGLTRSQARETTRVEGRPAYGGTPTDASVRAAIADLKARGLAVVFYPFVMMDIAGDNALPDPWTGETGQPAYPWRGRIVCDPAPGRPGTVDATAEAGEQVEAFFGADEPRADEWSYRRFILHYAKLCAQAGGVDAFLIGSEFVALTRVRSASGVYPAAQALAALAADVKAILGPATKVSYAADWTEYGAHVLDEGREVRFPLDQVWASPAVDFVGVDFYPPLSDWRDGTAHLDAAEAASVYDAAYLRRRVAGGEAHDWFYADATARLAQARSPISDGAYGKPWTFRAKDFAGWWSSPHVERVGGAELAAATAWTPGGKPIWLTEIGCPAVDRGANAPNVFPDPKSAEATLPPFSRGFRDDLMQARAIEAIISRFDPEDSAFVEDDNPLSPLYGGRMVDPSRIHVWAWDARPFPAFPSQQDAWSDAPQWEKGHWINGRFDSVSLEALVGAICVDAPLLREAGLESRIDAVVDGYVIDRPMSARAALEPLANFFAFDGIISGGRLRFEGRAGAHVRTLDAGDLVPQERGESVTYTRSQESELPQRLAVTFWDGESDYRTATAQSRRIEGGSRRETATELALVTWRGEAQRRCDVWLQDIWAARETAAFNLRPGLLALEVGDVVRLPGAPSGGLLRIERIVDGPHREVEARAVELSVFDHPPPAMAAAVAASPRVPGPPLVHVLDLALVRQDPSAAPALQHIAVHADPWPGPMAVWREEGGGFSFLRMVEQPALLGVTLDDLRPGVVGRFDRANTLTIRLAKGALASVDPVQALAGRTAFAVQGPDGAWEVMGFAKAEPVAENIWRLSALLRGLGGEEALATRLTPAGAPVVVLDEAVVPLTADAAMIGAVQTYRVGPAARGHGDIAVTELQATARDIVLRPYAPAHPRARRTDAGVEISFVRRGRLDADDWTALDIPLGEASEAYEIEILEGATVKRVLRCASASALYSTEDELADFGGAQSRLSLRLFQISARVGRGFPLTAQVSLA